MKAPDKIYLQICGDCNSNDCENCKFEDLEDNVTWWKDKIFKKDVEYTRTDAFIEKSKKYLTEKFIKDVSILAGGVVSINFNPAISNFVKYMKGE